MGTLARMGAVCVDYDLFGWGESALQVGSAAHRSSAAHTIQAMNGLLILTTCLLPVRTLIPAVLVRMAVGWRYPYCIIERIG